MTRKQQSRAPGQFADLNKGRTHFRWNGPEDGPVVVCVHGLSTPSYIFSGVEHALIALGFRVLTYDLYGRGFSDRASGKQSLQFFKVHLRQLLEHEQITEPFVLVGYSMGGMIATSFAADEPSQVRALVLLASAGMSPTESELQSKVWTWPIIGDWMMYVFGGIALRKELATQIETPTMIPDLLDRQAAESNTRGYLAALLSSQRHALSETVEDAHRKIGKTELPALAIWGTLDPVTPISGMGRLSELNINVCHEEIVGGGHAFPQTHPGPTGDYLRAFLISKNLVP